MFMSEILMMTEDVGLDSFGSLPLNMLPNLNIFWEYGVCYPLIRYGSTDCTSSQEESSSSCSGSSSSDEDEEEEDEEDEDEQEDVMRIAAAMAQDVHSAFLFLHPTRFSMVLWTLKNHDYDEEVLDETYHADIEYFHELSLLESLPPYPGVTPETTSEEEEEQFWLQRTTVQCSDMQHMQSLLFKIGLGPMPLFRRPGVLLALTSGLGIIVAHKRGVHGCLYQQDKEVLSSFPFIPQSEKNTYQKVKMKTGWRRPLLLLPSQPFLRGQL